MSVVEGLYSSGTLRAEREISKLLTFAQKSLTELKKRSPDGTMRCVRPTRHTSHSRR